MVRSQKVHSEPASNGSGRETARETQREENGECDGDAHRLRGRSEGLRVSVFLFRKLLCVFVYYESESLDEERSERAGRSQRRSFCVVPWAYEAYN